MALVSLISLVVLCVIILAAIAGLICLLALYTDKIWLVMVALIGAFFVAHYVILLMTSPVAELVKEMSWLIPS